MYLFEHNKISAFFFIAIGKVETYLMLQDHSRSNILCGLY